MQKNAVAAAPASPRTGGSRRSVAEVLVARRLDAGEDPHSSLLRREGTKKASREAWEGDEAAVRRLRAHAPASPRGPHPEPVRDGHHRVSHLPVESSDELCRCLGSKEHVLRQARALRHPPPPLDRGVSGSLSLLGGFFTSSQIGKRWFESFSIPGLLRLRGEPADAEDLRQRRAGAARPRLPVEGRRHPGEGDREGGRGGRGRQQGLAHELLLLDRHARLRLEGRSHDLRGDLPGPAAGVQLESARQGGARCVRRRTRHRA